MSDPDGDDIAPGTGCPHCGEPVERRQLVCLNCGGRVALTEGRSWAREPVTALAAALMAVIVIGAGLSGFAISELTSDDGGDGDPPRAAQAGSNEPTPEVVPGSVAQPRTQELEETSTEPQPEPDPGAIPGWPAGVRGHTVILVTTSDGPAARRVAREARGSGLEAGLIRSEPYDLGTGLFVVYSGRFDTREGASRQAAGLQDRYPGAYVQLIQRSQ